MVLVVLPDKPLEHTLVTGRRFGKAVLVEEQEVSVALLAHPDGPFLGVRQLHAVNAPGTQGILFQNGHQVFPALLGAPLDILPMAVLPGVKLADRHLLADGVDPIVNVPQEPVHHKDFPVLLGQSQKRLGRPVVLDQDHGPSHREGRVFSRVAVIYRKLGHFCLGQFFQRCETLLVPADLAIAVARLAFQHLLAVAIKGVLLVLVVAVRFQVLTSLRAGRQFFSSPFAHYSFTSGPVWPVFWIYLKNFCRSYLAPFVSFRLTGRNETGRGAAARAQAQTVKRDVPYEM